MQFCCIQLELQAECIVKPLVHVSQVQQNCAVCSERAAGYRSKGRYCHTALLALCSGKPVADFVQLVCETKQGTKVCTLASTLGKTAIF